MLKADGTIMNGNTRVTCLEENGYDLNKLWELVEPPKASSPWFDDFFE